MHRLIIAIVIFSIISFVATFVAVWSSKKISLKKLGIEWKQFSVGCKPVCEINSKTRVANLILKNSTVDFNLAQGSTRPELLSQR